MINTREVAAEYRLSHWAQIIQERQGSGLSIKDYCKQKEICGNTYFYWQRKVRAAVCEQLVRSASESASLSAASFTEVRMTERPAPPATSTPGGLRIEVSGIQITADSTYPSDRLAVFVRELARS